VSTDRYSRPIDRPSQRAANGIRFHWATIMFLTEQQVIIDPRRGEPCCRTDVVSADFGRSAMSVGIQVLSSTSGLTVDSYFPRRHTDSSAENRADILWAMTVCIKIRRRQSTAE
jgi:hypothetical protein